KAIEALERVRGKVGGDDDRVSFFRDKVEPYKKLIGTLLELHSKDARPGYDVAAFHYAERARARAFLDLLADGKVNVEQGIDADLLKRQQEIQADISRLNRQIINERSKETAKQDKAKIKEWNEALNKADLEQSDWLRELRRSNQRYADLKSPEPLKLEEAQRTLGDRSLLLAYSLGEQDAF